MSIAEKLTTIAENQKRVYDAGFTAGQAEGGSVQDNARYASSIRFHNTAFPEGYEMLLKLNDPDNLPQFRGATGIRKVTIDVHTDKSYDASNFLYNNTTIEELVFPDGIQFSSLGYFATNCKALKRVVGRVNMTGITTSSIYNGCSALEEVYFMPNTIGVNFDIKHSALLIDASVQSIIDGLADLSGTEPQTLFLNNAIGAKLTDAQRETIAGKNWILSLY